MKKFRKINEAEVQETEQTKKPSPEQKSQGQEKPSVEVIMTKTKYTDAVSKLQEIFKGQPDEKTKQWIEILKGDQKNDKVTISDPVEVSARLLLPTQNEIDFNQSLAFPLKNPPTKTFEKQGNFSFENSPKNALLIAEIGGKNYIIDGHHRWSGAYLVNRECDMNCYVMSGFKNAEEALKATQLAIAKATGEKKGKFPFATTDPGINLLDAKVTEDTFKNKVKETITGEGSGMETRPFRKVEMVVQSFINAQQFKEFIENKKNKESQNQEDSKQSDTTNESKLNNKTINNIANISDYLWENVLFMRNTNPMQSPSPKRDYMPQTGGSKKTIILDPVADVINPLKAGEVNIKPNYESHIIKTYEKFMQNWKK